MLPVRFFTNRVSDFCPEPVSSLTRWPRDLDDLFDWARLTPTGVGFRVDVREDGDDLLVEAEVPGLSKDDIEITVEDGVLTVAGEHKDATEQKDVHYHVRERRYGRVSRSFRLPSTADGDQVSAELKDGVLTVRVPTREEAKPRQIEVK